MSVKPRHLFTAFVAVLCVVNLNIFGNNRAREKEIAAKLSEFSKARRDEFICGVVCGSEAGAEEAIHEIKSQPDKDFDYQKDIDKTRIGIRAFEIRSRDFRWLPPMALNAEGFSSSQK